jgi:hypothetical protein
MISGNWHKSAKISILFLCLWLVSQGAISQEGFGSQPVPDTLRRPEWGEAPRYPQDLVIGELGQGNASEGAYIFSQGILSAVIAGRRESSILTQSGYSFPESFFEKIANIRPRSYRLGGGRIELDGCVSFVVRIIGPEESITGELFIRLADALDDETPGRWLLDDLIIEDKRPLSEIRNSYRYDFSPYERFF